MSERATTLAALVLLLLGGVATWHNILRPPLRAEPSSLAEIPFSIPPFEGVDTRLDQQVEEMLSADYNLQRQFFHPLGQVVWLYVGYYGTERGGTPEHTPNACYAAHGWSIVEENDVLVDAATGRRAVEMLVESGGSRQLVFFWYRSFRRSGLLSTFALQLDHIAGKLLDERGDGALVRLSTPVWGDERDAARALLLSFARKIEPHLSAAWPSEAPMPATRSLGAPGPPSPQPPFTHRSDPIEEAGLVALRVAERVPAIPLLPRQKL